MKLKKLSPSHLTVAILLCCVIMNQTRGDPFFTKLRKSENQTNKWKIFQFFR